MRKQTKRVFTILGIVLAIVLLAFLANNFFTIIPPDSTAYKTVSFTSDSITYSGVISPDYNLMKTSHLFAQWTGGNVDYFQLFYKNLGFLPFYIQQGLDINANDFSILPGDGDKMMYGTHLKPTYCNIPSGDKIFKYLDISGCPIYDIRVMTLRACMCPGGNYYTGATCDQGYPPCNSANQYSIIQTDVGGSNSGAKNYKGMLESDGWTWDNSAGAWNKGSPSSSALDVIVSKLTCTVSGTSDKGMYILNGKVKWKDVNGFSCEVIPGEFSDSIISSGTVDFKPAQMTTFYRLENNQCNQIQLMENLKTSSDYSSQSECQAKIIQPTVPTCESTNTCTATTPEPGTTESPALTESNSNIFWIIVGAVILIIGLIVIFIWFVRR